MSGGLKVASHHVRATVAQSARWKQTAEAEGFSSVGAWAAQALDAYLKLRARTGAPIPLSWHKGQLRVTLDGGETVTVPGFVSPPFGAFRGTSAEGWAPYLGRHRHTLVHLPSARVIATLRTYRHCQALAAELAPVLLRGELPDSATVVDHYRREEA